MNETGSFEGFLVRGGAAVNVFHGWLIRFRFGQKMAPLITVSVTHFAHPPPRSPNHFNIKSLQSIPSWSIINRLIANWITCINFNEFNQIARGLINEPNGNWIALIFSILAIQSTWSTFINRLCWSLHFQFGFEANDRLMAHNCCFWW